MVDAEKRVARLERSVLAESQLEGPEAALGDLLVDIEAGRSFKTPGRPADPAEWGVIKVSAMTWGEFRGHENKAVPPGQPIDVRYEIKPGDLLLSRANTSEYVGAPVLVRDCRQRLLLSDKSMRLVPKPGVDIRWLRYSLASLHLRRQMSIAATGTSDSMRNISQSKVRALRLRVPGLDRQAAIADRIDASLTASERLRSATAVATRRSAALRRSILAAAFTGKLVPQDPDDEPASVLLARIRAEREAEPPVRRARRGVRGSVA